MLHNLLPEKNTIFMVSCKMRIIAICLYGTDECLFKITTIIFGSNAHVPAVNLLLPLYNTFWLSNHLSVVKII